MVSMGEVVSAIVQKNMPLKEDYFCKIGTRVS